MNKPTHKSSYIIDWVDVQPDGNIHEISTVTDSFESDHFCIKSYFKVSVLDLLPYTGHLLTL